MPYTIKNLPLLKKLLLADALLGSSTALVGLLFSRLLANLFGLAADLVHFISMVTLIYALGATYLVNQKILSIPLLITLVAANWAWVGVSGVLFSVHYLHATALGVVFLLLQMVVVGGLAYLEGRQISRAEK